MPVVVVQVGARYGERALEGLALHVELDEEAAVLQAEHEIVVRVARVDEQTCRSARAKLERQLFLERGREGGAVWHLEREVLASGERELLTRTLRLDYKRQPR